MNKPFILSLTAASILSSNLNAESMYERFETMEMQMRQMQEEITTLRAQQVESAAKDLERIEESSNLEEYDEDDLEAEDDADEDEDDEDEMNVEEEIIDIQESITDLNIATNGSHLKFSVDYRFSLDNLQYKMADGSKSKNDAFMTNRFWLNMNWKATDNLSFTGQMAYNKHFGARSGVTAENSGFEIFDWITNENAYDGEIRIRSLYFLYKNDTFLTADIPWTFSIGRRPSTNGHLVNLRDDDQASSPMGHTINVEFDGMSSKFSFDNLTGIDGMYIKLCAGRGLTNALPKFNAQQTPYATDDNSVNDIDLVGLIFVPYNDGQYGIATEYYYANNLIDVQVSPTGIPTGDFNKVGGLHSFTANFTMNGIGDEWSDYLDDTFFFLSGAVSQTDPKADTRMLYNTYNLDGTMNPAGESKTGYSAWVGIQMPSIISEEGKWGLEYNWGSQYWRSITYAEDTNIGSKLATRGSAYEAYFTEPLIDDILSLQVRYTYIDYTHSGSNGFFGETSGNALAISDIQDAAAAGNPFAARYASSIVETAQDIRFYLRYRY